MEVTTATPSRLCPAETLVQALSLENLDRLSLTSFSLDEVELFSLARLLGLGSGNLLARFDRSGFGSRLAEPIVPRTWLGAIAPSAQTRVGARVSPPAFHPKLALAEGRGRARMVVSTANLSADDQRRATNVFAALDVDPPAARTVREWIERPGHRTLLVRRGENGSAWVETGDWPTWQRFRALIGPGGDWVMASPFWSQRAMREVLGRSPSGVDAYFLRAPQAQACAFAVRDAHARALIRCWAPGAMRFHHKVIAWRGTTNGKMRCVAYIGSANLTNRGFFGIDGRAWNWEAGLLLEGGAALWGLGVAMARAGLRWRAVPMGRRHAVFAEDADEELDERGLDAIESRLPLHLGALLEPDLRARVIRVHRRRWLPPRGARLEEVELIVDERPQRSRHTRLGPVPRAAQRVAVAGTYGLPSGDPIVVELEIPELCAPPSVAATRMGPSEWRAILTSGDKDAAGPFTRPDEGDDSALGVANAHARSRSEDIRFPLASLVSELLTDRTRAERWLRGVAAAPGSEVPDFWRDLARKLLR